MDTLPWVKELSDVEKGEIKVKEVDSTHPNYDAVLLNVKKGIISIDEIKGFDFDGLFVRMSLFVISGRLTELFEQNFALKFPIIRKHEEFSDYIDTSSLWRLEVTIMVVERGFVNGFPDGYFYPQKIATIKEVKFVLQRIKEKTEALLKEKEAEKKP